MSALEHPFPEHPPSWDSLNSIEMMEQFQVSISHALPLEADFLQRLLD